MANEAAAAQQEEEEAPSGARFTERELAAAEQLIHLSESSCGSSYGAGGALPRGSVASASSTSSPRSVNAPPPPVAPATPAPPPPPPPAAAAGILAPAAEDEEEEEEDQQEVGGRRRRNKRYRLIAEIYAATEPKPIGAGPRRRKADRASTDGAAPEARK